MTLAQDLSVMKQRIATAERLRDAWRAQGGQGGQEKYLEACSMVSALALQLENLQSEQIQATSPRLPGAGALD